VVVQAGDPQLRILVGAEWWCQWWEKIEEE